MQNQELDHRKQSEQFWERFRLYNENERSERARDIHRWAAIYTRYKLTKAEWQTIYDMQHGCCAICGVSQENLNHPLEIDRDQVTGRIRGLLCRKCNCGIGMFGVDVEDINKAIRYLEKS